VYDHARTVAAVVRGAREHATTVLVCDDGSTDGSGEAAASAGAIVLRHAVNQGKGAALWSLLHSALDRKFRYAISIDADGQHLTDDLPKLAALAYDEPGTLLIGERDLIGAGAPPSSEFGRKFSNFWVWFEAGARVEDSQSGFRAYPLPEVIQLRPRNRRYDFEVEVLLRAAWAGIQLRSAKVGVLYPPDRISHFHPFLDNVRISVLNTLACVRLLLPLPLGPQLHEIPHRPGLSVFALRRWAWLGGGGPVFRELAAVAGALPAASGHPEDLGLAWAACALAGLGAAPAMAASYGFSWLTRHGFSALLSTGILALAFLAFGIYEAVRRRRRRGASRWTGKSRGGVVGHWFFFQLTRSFGGSVAQWALYPVALYFVLTARTARNASRQFLDRALGPTHWIGHWVRAYRHFLAFARTLVDRALLATRGPTVFRYQAHGLEFIRTAAAEGRGAILLTAHLGNWELAAGMLEGLESKLAIVAFQGEHERLARFLERAQGPRPRIIQVGTDLLASLEILQCLRKGMLVALQGDRPLDDHVVKLPFLGREAPFPVGPFLLAAVSGAPLIATFSVQIAPAQYRFFAQAPMRFSFAPGQSRDAMLRTWALEYVRLLESVARDNPYQWFNFYDFWDAPPPRIQYSASKGAGRSN